MKKIINNIRENATDEEKLSYALFASIGVASVMLLVWFTTLPSDIMGKIFSPSPVTKIQKASVLDTLQNDDLPLENTKEDTATTTKEEIKPQEINI